ncbi:hypothetical protein IEQ34_006619 [Dendrobium chrysotoxum]|uniref:Uncharacterized protein n=1 Tax=Dendrobium chrysotoxum TaxID=161865 RepID=A0AAV7H8N3_DENCH|nr:hypothetical protein IEQ34_006619 [Dendrobium chrysotoxum]
MSRKFGLDENLLFKKVLEFCSHCKVHGHALTYFFRLHPNLKKTSNPQVGKATSNSRNSVTSANDNDLIHLDRVEPPFLIHKLRNDVDFNSDLLENRNVIFVEKIATSVDVPNIEAEKVPDIYVSIDSMFQNNDNP